MNILPLDDADALLYTSGEYILPRAVDCTTPAQHPLLIPQAHLVALQLLMSTITDHGGDVLRLAGDALIVVFAGKN